MYTNFSYIIEKFCDSLSEFIYEISKQSEIKILNDTKIDNNIILNDTKIDNNIILNDTKIDKNTILNNTKINKNTIDKIIKKKDIKELIINSLTINSLTINSLTINSLTIKEKNTQELMIIKREANKEINKIKKINIKEINKIDKDKKSLLYLAKIFKLKEFFYGYNFTVENFNALIHEIISHIKDIIISINNIVIHSSISKTYEFIKKLHNFLSFLENENIFSKLSEYKEVLNAKNFFIYPIIKKIPIKDENRLDINLQKNINKNNLIFVNYYEINLNKFIKDLLNIDLRSQIIISTHLKRLFNFETSNNDSEKNINKLQKDYINVIEILLNLEIKLNVNKSKYKSIFIINKNKKRVKSLDY